MEILNTKTNLKKTINKDNFSVHELTKIYTFYSNHKNFAVIIDGEVD